MKKKFLTVFLAIVLCWGMLVTIEGVRLIGSTDPRKYPLLYISGTHIQDKLAGYNSLGFSQEYHLSDGDSFVCGEFSVLGITIARWEDNSISYSEMPTNSNLSNR